MNAWHYFPAHRFPFAGVSYILWRFTAGIFGPVEFEKAVVDDFGNLVPVQS